MKISILFSIATVLVAIATAAPAEDKLKLLQATSTRLDSLSTPPNPANMNSLAQERQATALTAGAVPLVANAAPDTRVARVDITV
ncbi:hypothetical protein BGZ65_011195, partial [Modicella reniformis]